MSTVDQQVVEQSAPTDAFLKVETRGIEPIPPSERKGSPRDVAWLWVAAFANFVSLITGGLLVTFGLGVGEAIVAVAAGSVLAAILHVGPPRWLPPATRSGFGAPMAARSSPCSSRSDGSPSTA
ncbi:MAG: hypothetical protein E6H98_02635 [Chloroflexi bacterium]|nr:MAG: hypothetical protein E6H98_02635 [Chloroflexota bacterium]